jgi:hypothetical protein
MRHSQIAERELSLINQQLMQLEQAALQEIDVYILKETK